MSIFEDKKFDSPTDVEIFFKGGQSFFLGNIVDLSFQNLEDGYMRVISINEDGKKYENIFSKSEFVRMKESEPFQPYFSIETL